MPAPAVAINRLAFAYVPGEPALAELSAEIRPGRVTGLVGPDGAGKTTLIRLLAGLLLPAAGTIEVFGHDTRRAARHLPRLIGYMPQKFGLYEDLSVLQNLRLYADLRGVTGAARERGVRAAARIHRPCALPGAARRPALGGDEAEAGARLRPDPQAAAAAARRAERRRRPGVPAGTVADGPGTGRPGDGGALVDRLSRRGGEVRRGAAAQRGAAALCRPAAAADRAGGRALLPGPGRERQPPPAADAGLCSAPKSRTASSRGRTCGWCCAKAPLRPPRRSWARRGARLVAVAPRFEDAFVDLLGGGPGGESVLADDAWRRLRKRRSHRRGGRADQALRRFHRGRRRHTSASAAARSSGCWDPTAPASRPPSRCCAAC